MLPQSPPPSISLPHPFRSITVAGTLLLYQYPFWTIIVPATIDYRYVALPFYCFVLCKVEFIQPSNWLYSVPNLLVIQHLVTPYLGGFDVRVMSEIEWSLLKSVQENRDSRLGLAGDSRLQAARRSTRAKYAGRWTVMLAGALQDKTGQLAIWLSRDWISRLSQAASHPCFVKPDVSHSSPTPV